jgi:hypothetical protein
MDLPSALTTLPSLQLRTISDSPPAFPEIRCNSNSTCPPSEFCYDHAAQDWLKPSASSSVSGVCLGRKCDNRANAAVIDYPTPCRPNQVCAHRVPDGGPGWPCCGMTIAKNGRCLDAGRCTIGKESCQKGWKCINTYLKGGVCAPEEFTWGMVTPYRCNPATNGGLPCPQTPP